MKTKNQTEIEKLEKEVEEKLSEGRGEINLINEIKTKLQTLKKANNNLIDDVEEIINLDVELSSFLLHIKDKETGEIIEVPKDIQIILNSYWDYLKKEIKQNLNKLRIERNNKSKKGYGRSYGY